MNHMRENVKKNRGLYILVAALLVVYSLEPGLYVVRTICVGTFNHVTSGLYR